MTQPLIAPLDVSARKKQDSLQRLADSSPFGSQYKMLLLDPLPDTAMALFQSFQVTFHLL
jgi:hypothetical protein